MRELIAEIGLLQQALESKDREIKQFKEENLELKDRLNGIYLSVSDI